MLDKAVAERIVHDYKVKKHLLIFKLKWIVDFTSTIFFFNLSYFQSVAFVEFKV